MNYSFIMAVERSVNLFNRGIRQVNIFDEGKGYVVRPGNIKIENPLVTLERNNFLGFFNSFQNPTDEEIVYMADYLMKELELN